MAPQNHDEDKDMPIITNAEKLPLPLGGSSTLAGQSPSIPNDSANIEIRESKKADSGREENGDGEDLEDDTSSNTQDSIQEGEAQHQSISSITLTKKPKVSLAKLYEIRKDEVGNEWFCVAGKQQKTVYHSDIRNELERYAEESTPHGGPQYTSMLGAGTDDKTSYHPLFDFCGTERADRPDCLFCFKQPGTRRDERSISFLVWNDMVVLDYQGEAVRALDLPLTISTKIGKEEARLEAMLRLNSNSGIQWRDILARVLRRGNTSKAAGKFRNALNMRLVRFRQVTRMISWEQKAGSKALDNYLLSIMTAEMVAKNTTKGLTDVAQASGEKSFIELLNLGIKSEKSQAQGNKDSKGFKDLKDKLRQADKWAQAQIASEAQNPTAAPSVCGETDCTSIESIVAFKLASLGQHRCDGSLAFDRGFKLDHAAPAYRFDNPRMDAFFGSPAYDHDEAFLLPDANDPYGLLSSPTVTAAQTCIVDFLLEPTRTHYRLATLIDNGSGEYSPIFTTDPKESYWQQLQALQSAFEQCWAHLGCSGHPPLLCGLLQLGYHTMTWNVHDVPLFALVYQTLHSCTTTFEIWKRRQAKLQRGKLLQHHHDLDDEKDSSGEGSDSEVEGGLEVQEEEDDEDCVDEAGAVEEVMEGETESETEDEL